MNLEAVPAYEWLSEAGLTERGQEVRSEYEAFCDYMAKTGMPGFQIARTKYFLQRQNYWTLPDGYALPPHTINVNVNNTCNYKCHYCDFGQRQEDSFYHRYNVIDKGKRIDMPLEMAKRIVDESRWFRPIIRASFREPMLYPNIFDFIEYTRSKELPFWLLTNGFNLERHADDLSRLGIESIRVSLDGPEAVHNRVRGVPGSFRKILDGVKQLIEARCRRGQNMQIGFYFTLSDYNSDALLELVETLDQEGLLPEVFVNFQWLLYTSKAIAEAHNAKDAAICGAEINESTVSSVDLEAIDLAAASAQAAEVARRWPASKGYRLHFRPSFTMEDLNAYRDTEDFPVADPRCRVLWYNLNINPNGDCKSFHHCLLNDVGNIKTASLLDIWNGQAMREQRQKLKEHGAYRGCARCWGVYSLLEDKKRIL
jgi:MoaA/NifB/PqqE/SkfB family radical SAM enzyme